MFLRCIPEAKVEPTRRSRRIPPTLLRTDVAYYFDDAPGRLQMGLGGGLSVVF